jgi:PAS domain S-box-containing protein
MEPINVRVLLIEDDEDDVLLTKEYLQEVGNFNFEVTWESDLSLAKDKLLMANYDISLIDYRLGRENGLDLIKFIQDKGVLTPAIVLTGQGDLKVDIDASRYGAADYLVKTELNAALLERSIRYALSQSKIIKELDEKEKRYRSLFERSIDPIFLASDKLVLADVNNAFLKFFDYTHEESMRITISSIFEHESDYNHFRSTLKKNEQIRDFEVSLVTKSGDKKICLINCVFIPDQSSEFCCYQGIIHDLSLRKQAEHDMLIAERLSLTGQIARTIAHEVRNPLTNLNLALDQLRSEIPADNESAKLYANIIERNADRIEQLVGEMLNSSRPKELHLELNPVSKIVDDTIALAIDRIRLNQIELITNYPPDLPRILSDKDKLQVALLNIIINAIEAMEAGKGVLTINGEVENNVLTITIQDNGKGISKTDLEKLFDPFFTGKKTGMGLGLTSTKNILNSHSAQIKVKSELNKGTTFCIHFKLAE